MERLLDFNLVIDYFPKILSALPVTLKIVGVSTVIGLILGVFIAFFRIEKIPILNQISVIFVSFIRGTPILVQLFVVYYGLPELLKLIGIDLSSMSQMFFLYVTYGLNTAAFQSETFRAAILSVSESQTEAALACGLTKGQMYIKIVFPQAVRVAIPSFGTTTVSLLQDTSLAFTIGVLDVIGRARAIGAVTFHVFEGYVVAAIIFIVCSFILERFFAFIEKRTDYSSRAIKDIISSEEKAVVKKEYAEQIKNIV